MKLCGTKLKSLQHFMWRSAKFYSEEAHIAYYNDNNKDGASSGGIRLWVAPPLIHLIHSIGHSVAGNVQWVWFKDVPSQDIAILNVYAPHSSADRCTLLMELISILRRVCRWVLAGDWNFDERRIDKSNTRALSLTEEERRIFCELKDLLQVVDNFPTSNSVQYSCNSKRRESNRVLAFLDRIYMPQT